jgi:putative transcriptional regulator
LEKTAYNRIKALLADHGVSNKELADAIGVSEQTVSNWCVQKYQPSLQDLNTIADYLKIDVRELLVPNKKSPKKDLKL